METLDKDTKIIRYMDLSKFLSLIHKKALYFSKFSELDDVAEGFFPFMEKYNEYVVNWQIDEEVESLFNNAHQELQYIKDFLKKIRNSNSEEELCLYLKQFSIFLKASSEFDFNVIINILDCIEKSKKNKIDEIELEKIAKNILIKKKIVDYNELSSKTIINCWNEYNETESDGMWKLYSSNKGKDGITIVSTIEKLEALAGFNEYRGNSFSIEINNIEYLNSTQIENIHKIFKKFTPETIEENLKKYPEKEQEIFNKFVNGFGLYSWFFIKRNCFEHEKEIRVVITPTANKPPNNDITAFSEIKKEDQYIKIGSLDDFIDEIIISPDAESYIKETLEGVLANAEDEDIKSLKDKVRESDLKIFNDSIKKLKETP